MVKINHYIGGILLVAGTTIGAGMLALPVMTAFMGFFPSIVIFTLIWAVMLSSAYFFLDVNLAIRGEPNLISMAHKTLGIWGKVVAWIFYLLLLYSLLAAYIAASTPLFTQAIYYLTSYTIPYWLAPFSLPVIFGGFIYLGTLGVDVINRFMMFGLVIAYFLLIAFLPEHIDGKLLTHVDWDPTVIALPVIITSFGYHIIIPSLTTYMKHDRKHLSRTIFIGSFVSLCIYLLWEFLIIGVVPLKGSVSFISAYQQGVSATEPLIKIVHSKYAKIGAQFFYFFAIVTSFLGVSLSLSDFLTDGLKIKKTWEGRLLALVLVFLPPLVFVFTYQRGFIIALEYAGAFIAILLIFLPAAMAWRLKKPKIYRTGLGRLWLIAVILFSFLILVFDILEQWGIFKPLLQKYVQ